VREHIDDTDIGAAMKPPFLTSIGDLLGRRAGAGPRPLAERPDTGLPDRQRAAPRTTYPSHVHSAPCGVDDANGHFMFDPAGPAEPPNEIWVGPFRTNGNGSAVASTRVDAVAGPGAVAVVVHAPDGSKVACADPS